MIRIPRKRVLLGLIYAGAAVGLEVVSVIRTEFDEDHMPPTYAFRQDPLKWIKGFWEEVFMFAASPLIGVAIAVIMVLERRNKGKENRQ